jgi:DNA-binding beta-propeller fold protein YncE
MSPFVRVRRVLRLIVLIGTFALAASIAFEWWTSRDETAAGPPNSRAVRVTARVGASRRHARTTVRRRTTSVPVRNVYAHDGRGMLSRAVRRDPPRVYVPNSEGDSVDVINPATFRIVAHFSVGALPEHVVPSFDLKTLYVLDDAGNTLTPIDPRMVRPRRAIPVSDPYNLYFAPNGHFAIIIAERLHRLDFRDPNTFRLRRSLHVPCAGVNHMDFSGDGRYALVSCEFSGQVLKLDLRHRRITASLRLPRHFAIPQDVRVAPNGHLFYVADLAAGGVWEIDGRRFRVIRFLRTGAGAHGLAVSRNGKLLYVANRNAGSVSVVSFRARRVVRRWWIPGGSPDMGGVSADGKVLWLSGRYDAQLYAISTRTGRLLARIPVGASPHGVCVWPQPGRHSLGHVGNMR